MLNITQFRISPWTNNFPRLTHRLPYQSRGLIRFRQQCLSRKCGPTEACEWYLAEGEESLSKNQGRKWNLHSYFPSYAFFNHDAEQCRSTYFVYLLLNETSVCLFIYVTCPRSSKPIWIYLITWDYVNQTTLNAFIKVPLSNIIRYLPVRI